MGRLSTVATYGLLEHGGDHGLPEQGGPQVAEHGGDPRMPFTMMIRGSPGHPGDPRAAGTDASLTRPRPLPASRPGVTVGRCRSAWAAVYSARTPAIGRTWGAVPGRRFASRPATIVTHPDGPRNRSPA
ncbi:hypothetical protein TBS_17510 [Thermobispora bispora]